MIVSATYIRILVGMQPLFKHVSSNLPLSTIATLSLCLNAGAATFAPALEPKTATTAVPLRSMSGVPISNEGTQLAYHRFLLSLIFHF